MRKIPSKVNLFCDKLPVSSLSFGFHLLELKCLWFNQFDGKGHQEGKMNDFFKKMTKVIGTSYIPKAKVLKVKTPPMI